MTKKNLQSKLKRKIYEKELKKLQVQLCHLQAWVKYKGLRVIILFEGRDAAGKGGAIKAITERVSPRTFKVVALPAPSDREKTELYIQRYMDHFPAAGEVIIFDRSWYNRAGVEYVMGFCTEAERDRFLEICPLVEKYVVNAGIILVKIWLEVGKAEQKRRFLARIDDPLRQWKLSGMDLESYRRWYDYSRDLESYRRWYDYSRARDSMLKATDSEHAPWHIVHSDDKRRARLNCIAHILSLIPVRKAPRNKVKLPKRSSHGQYDDAIRLKAAKLVPERY
jgi:polyphosphate kinase 2